MRSISLLALLAGTVATAPALAIPGASADAGDVAGSGRLTRDDAAQLRRNDNPKPAFGRMGGGIYINLATGERTTFDMDSGARGNPAPEPLWVTNNLRPCDPDDLFSVDIISNPDVPDIDGNTDGVAEYESGALGSIPWVDGAHLYWGDVPADTRVNFLVVPYATVVPDVDVDMDGVGDGVAGVNMRLFFNDGDAGIGDVFRFPLNFSFIIGSLPGQVDPDPAGLFTVNFLFLDLTGFFDADTGLPVDATFELGDTDGEGPMIDGVPNFNPNTFFDFEGDGLHDFSYAINFTQPQSTDDPRSGLGALGAVMVAPEFVNDKFDVAPLPSAQGLEDLVDWFFEPSFDDFAGLGDGYLFSFDYGGFDCGEDDTAADNIPFSHGYLGLYDCMDENGCSDPEIEPDIDGPCNDADFALPYDQLDFNDVQQFLSQFASQNLNADLDGDGVLTFGDIQRFLADFSAGCP